VYLNLVLEYVPETLYKLVKLNSKKGQVVSELHAKVSRVLNTVIAISSLSNFSSKCTNSILA